MKHTTSRILCALLALWMLGAASCAAPPADGTTSPLETTTAQTSTSETSASQTSASQTSSEQIEPPPVSLPAMQLREGDIVTWETSFSAVELIGEDKEYTVRVALLDTMDGKNTQRACYFDAIDAETGALVAHLRLQGAATLAYEIDPKNSTVTFSVTRISYHAAQGRLSAFSERYTFTNMTAQGASIEPAFGGLSGGVSFAAEGDRLTRFEESFRNFAARTLKKLETERETITYLASNDEVFLAYCAENAPSLELHSEMWSQEWGQRDAWEAFMKAYGIE